MPTRHIVRHDGLWRLMELLNGGKMIDGPSSERIDVIRFPLIVGVVFVHNFATVIRMSNSTIGVSDNPFYVDFIRNLVSNQVARIAVPLFFLISGYLFFQKFDMTWKLYRSKIKSRYQSLMIPFIIWNLLTIAAILGAQSNPYTAQFLAVKFAGADTGYGLHDLDAIGYIEGFLGIGRYPFSYQFWFIRDLLLLVIASPAIYILNRFGYMIVTPILAFWWATNWWPLPMPSIEATFCFSLGCLFALKGVSLFRLDPFGWQISIASCALAVAACLLVDEPYGHYVHKAAIVFGIITALFLTSFIQRSARLKAALIVLVVPSFFVYAAHEPLLTIVRKLAYRVLNPQDPAIILGLYFVLPLLVIVVLIYTYQALVRFAPSVAAMLTGRGFSTP